MLRCSAIVILGYVGLRLLISHTFTHEFAIYVTSLYICCYIHGPFPTVAHRYTDSAYRLLLPTVITRLRIPTRYVDVAGCRCGCIFVYVGVVGLPLHHPRTLPPHALPFIPHLLQCYGLLFTTHTRSRCTPRHSIGGYTHFLPWLPDYLTLPHTTHLPHRLRTHGCSCVPFYDPLRVVVLLRLRYTVVDVVLRCVLADFCGYHLALLPAVWIIRLRGWLDTFVALPHTFVRCTGYTAHARLPPPYIFCGLGALLRSTTLLRSTFYGCRSFVYRSFVRSFWSTLSTPHRHLFSRAHACVPACSPLLPTALTFAHAQPCIHVLIRYRTAFSFVPLVGYLTRLPHLRFTPTFSALLFYTRISFPFWILDRLCRSTHRSGYASLHTLLRYSVCGSRRCVYTPPHCAHYTDRLFLAHTFTTHRLRLFAPYTHAR